MLVDQNTYLLSDLMARRKLLVPGIICGTIWGRFTVMQRFFRAWGPLHAFASNADWSIGQATSFMIGQRDVTGFGFTKPFLCREHYFKCHCLNVLNVVTKNTFIGNNIAPL